MATSIGSSQRGIMGQKRCNDQHGKFCLKDHRKLLAAQKIGIQPFTEMEIASFQDATDLALSTEALKAAIMFRASISMTKLRAKPREVFVSLCHSSAAAGLQEEHCAMTWGELAKALNAFEPSASLQALHKIWCYTVENQALGLTFQDFKRWFWTGGETLIAGESPVMKKARLEPPALPPTQETERMLSADIEAKMLVLQKKHNQEVQMLQHRMADTERCCEEVLEQQSAEGQKLQEGWQKLHELQQASPSRNACVVCFEPADWAIIPCGHTCYCQTHGGIAKALGNLCPVCRGEIRDGPKVFLSGMDP